MQLVLLNELTLSLLLRSVAHIFRAIGGLSKVWNSGSIHIPKAAGSDLFNFHGKQLECFAGKLSKSETEVSRLIKVKEVNPKTFAPR